MTDLKALIAIGPQRSGFEFPSHVLRSDHRRDSRRASKTPPQPPLSSSDEAFLRDIGLA